MREKSKLRKSCGVETDGIGQLDLKSRSNPVLDGWDGRKRAERTTSKSTLFNSIIATFFPRH